jgi:hypothetical protein
MLLDIVDALDIHILIDIISMQLDSAVVAKRFRFTDTPIRRSTQCSVGFI